MTLESLYRLIYKSLKSNKSFDFKSNYPSESFAPYKLFNIGNSSTDLLDYIKEIERNLNIKAKINFMGMHPEMYKPLKLAQEN